MNLRINVIEKMQLMKLTHLFLCIISCLSLSACQGTYFSTDTTTEKNYNTVNFSQYYMLLKGLSADEIQAEIEQQGLKKSQGNIEAQINLILLHSLPNSPIHNAYNAKSQLNDHLKAHSNYTLSSNDQAFISLLKDQLNQQLFLFQKLINQELAHDDQMAKNLIENKKQLDKIAALELTVTQLTKKITQLKKIEQTISDHGK